MIPINPQQIPVLFNEARSLLNAGKLRESELLLERLAGAAPNRAEIPYQLAQIAAKRLDLDSTERHLERALSLNSNEPKIWIAMADLVAHRNDPDLTSSFSKRSKRAGLSLAVRQKIQDRLYPSAQKTKVNTGGIHPETLQEIADLLAEGNGIAAGELIAPLKKKFSRLPVLILMEAQSRAILNEFSEARALYEETIRLDSNYAEAHNNYGGFLIGIGEHDAGIEQVKMALKLKGNLAGAHLNLALGLRAQGSWKAALAAAKRALQLNAGTQRAHEIVVDLLLRESRYVEALARSQEALAIFKDDPAFLMRAAEALAQQPGQTQAGIKEFERLTEKYPDNNEILEKLAGWYEAMGRFDDARATYVRALERNPNDGASYRSLSRLQKFTAEDPLLAAMEKSFKEPDVPPMKKAELCFALAKAMEDIKEYDRAFEYLVEGNEKVLDASPPYDPAEISLRYENSRQLFSDTDFSRKIAGTSEYDPIFVSGLPRTGTTLVEQIIGAHSKITPIGEAPYWGHAVANLREKGTGELRPVAKLSDAQIAEFGTKYEADCRDAHGDVRVVDKNMSTPTNIGFVRLTLPKSKLVLVHRDPRDSAVSMFKNVFPFGTYLRTCRLEYLGEYIRGHHENVAFWRKKVPNWFYEVHYEELTANPETEIRKMLDYLELEWEPGVLEHHKSAKEVRTLSVVQVRQPIYKSSTQAWKRYEKHLGPLFEELGDLID